MVKLKVPIIKSPKRLALKIVWFGFVLGIIGFVGAVISLFFLSTYAKLSKDEFIGTVIAATFVLLILIGASLLVLRKRKSILLRWTRKSLILTVPLLIFVAGLSVLAFNGLEDDAIGSTANVSEGLTGNYSGAKDIDKFSVNDLAKYTNEERKKHSKQPVNVNSKLNASAKAKCNDMIKRDYWSHNEPDGTEPWVFIKKVGYNYEKAGENLAYGYFDSKSVVTGWMNSPGHKSNLLDSAFTEVGFGLCESKNYQGEGQQIVIVQHFASPAVATKSSVAKPYVASVCSKTPIPYQTKYKYVDYMYEDEREEYGGSDGYKETCTADSNGFKPSDFTIPPHDKTIYIGTREREVQGQSTYSQPRMTYQQAANNCSALGAHSGSAFQQCINAYLSQY